ncbi:hypothetical protein [Pleionea sediminis]|uniref:hypothetical protein n=1 Tax=Pleionea sediminis TaxID=2569479 RepID=UPI001184EA1B|nr:hypothetical protein [Pleionea sediminis]
MGKINLGILFLFMVSEISAAPINKNISVTFGFGESTYENSLYPPHGQDTSAKSFEFLVDYSVNEYLSVGAGYLDFGRAKLGSYPTSYSVGGELFWGDSDTYTDGDGFILNASLSTGDLFSKVKAFIRGGYLDWSFEELTKGVLESQMGERKLLNHNRKYNGLDPFLGYGISYQLFNNTLINITYDKFDVKLDELKSINSTDGTSRTFNYKQNFEVWAFKFSYLF